MPESTSPQAPQDTPTTPWSGLPVSPGRCARIYLPTGPAGHFDHPLGKNPEPPGAGVPESTSPQALQDTPTTPWAGLPIPLGRCARFYLPTGATGDSDHPLGRTPHPPRPVCPNLLPHSHCRTLRPPPGQDSPSPQAGVPESTSPQALQDTLTTPSAGLSVPPGQCARVYLPTGPAGHSDHPLGRTPHPPRPVCPNLHPHRPCRTLRPPPGQDSPSP